MGDIFCRQRMFNFKMVSNDNCEYCGCRETVLHVLWDCNRAKLVWDQINVLLNNFTDNLKVEYANIFVGYEPTNIIAESIITRVTKMIMSYERKEILNPDSVKNQLIDFCSLNRYSFKGKNYIKLNTKWDEIISLLRESL